MGVRLWMVAVLMAAPGWAPAWGQMAEQRLPVCLACHGPAGTSKIEGVPSLGAMPTTYVLTQLYMFRENMRVAAPMNTMAAGLSDDDLRTLGDTIAKLPAPQPEPALAAADGEHGQALVSRYHCNSCHGADLGGRDSIPRIAGQRQEYLLKSLTEYKSNARPGYSPAMSEVAQELKAEDIPVLAQYVAQYR